MQAPSEPSSILDIRLRPIAALQAIPGAELGLALTPRLEIGPTAHYFSGTNTFANTSLRTVELGIKATYIVWEAIHHEGVYVSGAFYDYINNQSDSSVQPTYSSGSFSTLGYTITTGYQWDLKIFHNDAWTLRLGAGWGYGQQHFQSVSTQSKKNPTTAVGVQGQLEPTLEFTIGYWI
jgi:hypothetical protein